MNNNTSIPFEAVHHIPAEECVLILGEITHSTYLDFIRAVRERLTDRVIYLIIDSEGGTYTAGMNIARTIINSGLRFIGINSGTTDSVAVNIMLACNERWCTPDSTFINHVVRLSSNDQDGNIVVDKPIDNRSKYGKHVFKHDFNYIRSRIPKEKMSDSLLKKYLLPKEDSLMLPEEALKYGVVNEIKQIYLL